MQIQLTVESIDFVNLTTTQTSGFETTKIANLLANPNATINGTSYFDYQEKPYEISHTYTVTETVAAVDLIGSQIQFESQVAAVGSETLLGSDVIVGIAAAGFMATTAGDMTKGLIGGRYKVYGDVTSTCTGSVAALWLDNQMSCAVTETEYSIRSSTGGTVPDAWAGFTTTSSGWANLLHFNATMVGKAPLVTSFAGNGAWVPNNKGTFTQEGQIKILIDATPYYIPYGTVA